MLSQTYNTFGEVAKYSAKISATTLLNEQYTRDNLGRITKKTETVDAQTFTYDYAYDTAGRLTDVKLDGAVKSQYTYDANGNRVGWATPTNTLTAVYDDQDRLLIYGASTYAYTANGALATKTVGWAPPTTYTYDGLGNLTTVTLPDATQIDYIIDGQNRRIGKKVNGILAQAFLYENQLRPVAELDATGNVVSRFVYATKVNVPDYIIKNGITYSVIIDHLGSPRIVVDATTGTVAQKLDYDEFGNIILDTNPGFQPFGFAGGLYDVNTRLTRFGARDYDAETGRWTTKDPIGFGGGDNFYAYVDSDPVNRVDYSGLLSDADKVTLATSSADIILTTATVISNPIKTVFTLPLAVANIYLDSVGATSTLYLPTPYSDAIGLASSSLGVAVTMVTPTPLSVVIGAVGFGYTAGTLFEKYVLKDHLIDAIYYFKEHNMTKAINSNGLACNTR